MARISPRTAMLLVLMAIMLLAPLLFPSSFYYRIGALIFINSLSVIGLVILVGFAGQVSLGHAGFAGIGAYACALAPVHLALHPALAMILGAAISAAVAWLVGRPILRLSGHFLAVATLGFGILVFIVLNNESWLTGGPDGIAVVNTGVRDLLRGVGIKITTSELWYWICAAALLLGAFLALNLQNSPTGRALRSLHDSEVAARTIGIDVARMKLTAFVVSAVYTSVAGSLLAMMNRFVTPDIAGFMHSVELLTMTVLGGAGSVFGGFVGATILTAVPQMLTVFKEFENLLLGLIMMLVMIFLRKGLVPSIARRLRRGGQ
ncbi:MAG: branched-chain amino acid ABC transporter permease [Fimbriimonadaceae bacterium]|nr:branched-chain amino acid ABC transporter permease [Alphaproteobacteria bacterium]